MRFPIWILQLTQRTCFLSAIIYSSHLCQTQQQQHKHIHRHTLTHTHFLRAYSLSLPTTNSAVPLEYYVDIFQDCV